MCTVALKRGLLGEGPDLNMGVIPLTPGGSSQYFASAEAAAPLGVRFGEIRD
jgi:hypothetical protein